MLTVTEVCVPSLARYRERVGIGGAGNKLVVRRARRVGPRPGRIDGERAVAAIRARLRHERRCAVQVAGVSVPPVLSTASVSVRFDVASSGSAASSVPRMLTVTELSCRRSPLP